MEAGDRVLLFHDLPYDFEEQLPAVVAGSLTLQATPQGRLARHPPTAAFLLPGYGLPVGINNCCLVDSAPDQENPDLLFFNFLTALRLWKPIYINVGGSFTVLNGENEFFFGSPLKGYGAKSAGGQYRDGALSIDDFRRAARIREAMAALDDGGERKLMTAWLCFSQVTLGSVGAYQASIITLFAALEAFFTNGNSQPHDLAKRVSRFLQRKNDQFTFDVEEWLRETYVALRGRYAHGRYDALPGMSLRLERAQDFHRLHEIARLSVLGLLTKDRSWRLANCALTGAGLRQLDLIDPADSVDFLETRPFL